MQYCKCGGCEDVGDPSCDHDASAVDGGGTGNGGGDAGFNQGTFGSLLLDTSETDLISFPPCLLKVSVGIEDISDIIADFAHALKDAIPDENVAQ
jgi:hypothetical protein